MRNVDTAQLEAALRNAGDTKAIHVGAGMLGQVDQVLSAWLAGRTAIVIADDNTFGAAGRVVQTRLAASGLTVGDAFVFPSDPPLYAEYDRVLELERRLAAVDALPVAVGSGTLNDLTKLAAHRVGRTYACVATAASMDGYTAFGAAITRDGFKQTMACPAPSIVIADLDVLANAPASMTAAGYGDLLGKVTAGADWIVADFLGAEPIDAAAWSLVQDSLRSWTAEPEGLPSGDRGAIERLFEGLILTGIAMQLHDSSRPASGSEHRFSHLWEMEALVARHPVVPHGFKVGVGTIATAVLYEQLLDVDLAGVDIDGIRERWPSRSQLEQRVRALHAITWLGDHAVQESLAKHVSVEELRRRLELLRERWPSLRDRLARQLLPADAIRRSLRAAGCPTDPHEIGVTWDHLRASHALAQTIRARYTVLDLATETGLLPGLVDASFAPTGYWGRRIAAHAAA